MPLSVQPLGHLPIQPRGVLFSMAKNLVKTQFPRSCCREITGVQTYAYRKGFVRAGPFRGEESPSAGLTRGIGGDFPRGEAWICISRCAYVG